MILVTNKSSSFSSQRGFTLLEVMVTVGIIGLLFGFVIFSYNPDSNTDKMKKATIEMEALSARAHTMAMLHQQPFWLRFERNRVILQGGDLSAVDTSSQGPSREREEDLDEDDEERSPIVDFDTFEFPDGMEVFVRRWGAPANRWFHQEKDTDPVIFWNFAENGLCEPLSLRFEIGESWVVLEMDPLTALVADETSEIYD